MASSNDSISSTSTTPSSSSWRSPTGGEKQWRAPSRRLIMLQQILLISVSVNIGLLGGGRELVVVLLITLLNSPSTGGQPQRGQAGDQRRRGRLVGLRKAAADEHEQN
ncbi:hypothetical protein TYRP_001435 [Tyrophagus putrescentiae]|nr:hypothetical protein TYRP_001435 [Tyrophagus putrescentiae]